MLQLNLADKAFGASKDLLPDQGKPAWKALRPLLGFDQKRKNMRDLDQTALRDFESQKGF
jgi:hypothetical protein